MFLRHYILRDAEKDASGGGDSKTTIASSIAAAEVEIEKESKGEEEVKEPEKKPEKEPEKKSDEDEMSQEDRLQAKQLYLALKDPEKAGEIIKFLAEKSGYQRIETKQEVKEAKDEVTESLKKSLGPDFDFLADKLAPAIKEILEAKLTEHNKDIRTNFEKLEEEKLKGQANLKMNSLAKEFFAADTLPDDILTDMTKAMDRMNPSKDMTVEEYVEEVFYSVIGRKGITKSTKTKEDKIKRNVNDVPSRIASSGIREPETPESHKKMTLKESIAAAEAELTKE